MHSTATALYAIHDHIQRALKEKRPNKKTVMVDLDLSRVFDTVNIGILLKIILETIYLQQEKDGLEIICQGDRHMSHSEILTLNA